VAKQTKFHLGIEIDKLTNSIVNTISGDSFPTDVHPFSKADLKNVSLKSGWLFKWSNEFKQSDRQVFKLTIQNKPTIIQGLLSISDLKDHFYLNLIESAPFNLGKNKLYKGYKAIYLHLAARLLGTKDIKDLYLLHPNQSW
jgi:hypothetical protein